MKPRHVEGYRLESWATLKMLNIAVGQDFHTLRSEQVDKLLVAADRVGYRKPKNANGSRARYFFAQLQRRAQAK
jgi:hypothetical protein